MNETGQDLYSTNGTTNGAANGAVKSTKQFVQASLLRAEDTVRSHPYFATGVLAGVGIMAAGAIFLSTRRRPTLLERLADLF